MATTAKIKVSALVFDPIPASAAPSNSIYSDSSNANAFTNTSSGGDPVQVGESSSSSTLIKSMQNLSGATIPAGKPVAKKANGSIIAADSDGVATQQFIGIALASIANNATGNVAIVGQNVVGAVSGLGFAPGDDVYLSEAGGYTNDPNSFTGSNDSIIRVGIADCAAGSASATATDLIMFAEVQARP